MALIPNKTLDGKYRVTFVYDDATLETASIEIANTTARPAEFRFFGDAAEFKTEVAGGASEKIATPAKGLRVKAFTEKGLKDNTGIGIAEKSGYIPSAHYKVRPL